MSPDFFSDFFVQVHQSVSPDERGTVTGMLQAVEEKNGRVTSTNNKFVICRRDPRYVLQICAEIY
jgi:hypothetical protein